MEHKNAFTLTEVLLAVVIVGVIAALILPAMISKFNEQTLELGFKREINTISSAIDSLAVSENKTDFFSTMMYLDVVPESYDDSAGKFLKKYLRVAKYCGDDASDCFASKYYTYSNNEKKGYTPDYNGSCARLKNGMSICMSPQIGAKNIEGIIDLNGAKGPNVLGRDLRKFELQLKSRTNNVADSTEVIVANNGLVDLDTEETPEPPTDPCVDDNNSLSCCQVRGIVDSNDPCCTYNDFKGDSACKKNASVTATCRSATKIGAGVTPDGYTY
ncbi:MAG: type II secretion system GspH family protein, partial [Candidatus Gastranaerophilales bacterium]|nr:type II secretion system GspH family protein [Candidatus Gastranaerophilales bacterium]